jgi:hypothetical protein
MIVIAGLHMYNKWKTVKFKWLYCIPLAPANLTHMIHSQIFWVPASKQLTDKDSETATGGTYVIAYNGS